MNGAELSQRATDVLDRRKCDKPSAAELASLQLRRHEDEGHNIKYRTVGSERAWFIKFCKHDENRVSDICEREVLISLLGEVLRVPVVKAWLIAAADLTIDHLPEGPCLIMDKCVLMPMLDGSTICQAKEATEQVIRGDLSRVANLFAFIHWVGDEDRGLADVFLANGELVLIDNGLCGPGRDGNVRGAHPYPDVYRSNTEARVKKCYPGKPSLVAFVLRDLNVSARELQRPTVIESIESLPDDVLAQIVQAADLSPWIADVLVRRQPLIRSSYLEWLSQASQVCSPR